jgi:hypothetical protein
MQFLLQELGRLNLSDFFWRFQLGKRIQGFSEFNVPVGMGHSQDPEFVPAFEDLVLRGLIFGGGEVDPGFVGGEGAGVDAVGGLGEQLGRCEQNFLPEDVTQVDGARLHLDALA